MPIETYEVVEGRHIEVPSRDTAPGTASTPDAAASSESAVPGATDPRPPGAGQPSDSPPETPPAPVGEAGADTDDDEPLREDSEITAARLERRFKRLTAARRQAERERDALVQQHALELAQTRGQLDAMQRMLSGVAPPLPDTPAPPTGPPQADQFASHDEYVLAAARYGAQQELQARDQQTQAQRQQAQQHAFQQQLLEREQVFKQAHPDFDTVVRTGLAGKVSPVLQQALMLVPDGPAVAYALATQPDLVQRLNTLPPPLVLVELGRLSPPPAATPPGTPPFAPAGSAPSSPAPPLPAPPTPLSGASAGAGAGTYHEGMDQAAYRAWRKRTSDLPTWKDR